MNRFKIGDLVIHIFHKQSLSQEVCGVDGNYIHVYSHDKSYKYKAYAPSFKLWTHDGINTCQK